jgi:calcium-dependent protein kinase
VSEIIEQLLQAVNYMHEKGICHRDIKPQNILYGCMERQIKLIDFEISKMNRKVGKVEMWSMTGTLYYKAPEMFSGKYNELIDVWSIGVTAYELLTGSLPF